MGLIYAFNEVLSCVLTGLSTAVFIGIFARLGWLPMLYITTEDPNKKEDQGE